MDLATLIKPVLTAGELRIVGSTTFEEFKQIEKDRALARRLQKVVVEEPTVEETVKILKGLRSRYEEHHQVEYTDESLEVAAKLAKRFLRDYRLPDSAIDILDEAGAMLRLQATGAGQTVTAEASATAGGAATEAYAAATGRDYSPPPRRIVTVAEIERIVGRMARIPDKQASAFRQGAAAHARGIAAPRGLRPGRRGAHRDGRDQAVARGALAARSAGRVLPLHRPDRRRQDGAGQAAGDSTSATSSSATT